MVDIANFEFEPEAEGQAALRQLAAVDDAAVMSAAENMFSMHVLSDAERQEREQYFLDTLIQGGYISLQDPDITAIRGIKKACRRRLQSEGRF